MRPKGSITEALFARVEPQHVAQVRRTSEVLGISLGEYLDRVLAREAASLDEAGRPTWWNEPVPADQQVLDLDSREVPLKSA